MLCSDPLLMGKIKVNTSQEYRRTHYQVSERKIQNFMSFWVSGGKKTKKTKGKAEEVESSVFRKCMNL